MVTQALRYDRFGEPADVVAPGDVAVADPSDGQVRLRVLRSPIHNHDLSTIRGNYGYKPALPAVAGTELLGVVEAAGKGAELAVGTRVNVVLPEGAWAKRAIAPAQACVPIPDAIDDDRACQLMAMPLSALVLLDDLRVQPGDWIVQNAAGGAVGRILMKVAQSRGVNVVNIVRRESAAQELRSFGAEHVVVNDGAGFTDAVHACSGGKPMARVVDSVCGPTSIELQRLLGRNGEYVIFGALAGGPIKLDPGAMIFAESSVRGFWMTAWMTHATAQERQTMVGRIFELAIAGELPLPTGGVFPLSDCQTALAEAERPGRPGKMLFAP